MTYLVEFPVDGGGQLLVQALDDDVPGGLELAALRPGEAVARAGESLEAALDRIKPAIHAIASRLTAMGPDEAAIEFGIMLGAETGAIIAKGTAEVHFNVTITWKRAEGEHRPASAAPGPPGAGPEAAADA